MTPRAWFTVCGAIFCAGAFAQTLTFSGVVFGTDGKPAPGVRVWFSQDRVVQTKETDGRGSFAFASVRPGVVDVVAWREGTSMAGYTGRVADDSAVPLYLGEATEVDLRILSHAFAPVAGARLLDVVVSDAFRVPADDFASYTFPSIRSDEQGFLTIPGVPRHSFVRFNVDHIDHAQTYIAYFAAGRDRQDIVLRRGIDLRGRVYGPSGEAVERARVGIAIQTLSGDRALAEPLTDPEGYFHAKVSPGEVVLYVRHPDYAPADPKHFRIPATADEMTAELSLHKPHAVTGTVLAPDGSPAVGVDVAFIRNGASYAQTITGGDGRYLLQVAPGTGSVAVHPPQGLMSEGLAARPVEVAEGTSVDLSAFQLVPLPVVEGVVRGRDGSAEHGVYVRSTNLERPLWAITDADGRFSIPLGTAQYRESITFSAEHGLRFYRGEFTVDPHDAKPLDIRLSRYEPDETPVREGTVYAKLAGEEKPAADSDEFRVETVGNDLSDLLGKPAPEWQCTEWFNGDAATLAGLRGKVVVMTLWGGFAVIGPGRERIDELNWLYKTFSEVDDVAFVGIHDSSIEADGVEQYIADYGIAYPIGHDQEPALTFTAYHTSIIPQTVLIDKTGAVRYFDVDGRLLELIKALRRE